MPSLFLIAALAMSLGLLLLTLLLHTAAALLGDVGDPADHFHAYAQIMPGQPASALPAFGCIIWRHSPYRETCSIFPSEGSFHLITIRARQDLDLIEEATFFSTSLSINRLYHRFGSAAAIERGDSGHPTGIRWQEATYSVTLPLPRATFMFAMRHVIMRHT
jgi:hypothetical protein